VILPLIRTRRFDIFPTKAFFNLSQVVGYNPPLLCYPHNKSREVNFPDLEEFAVGDAIGLLVTVCAEMLVTRNGKEVLRVPLRGCPQRLPSMTFFDLSGKVSAIRLVDGMPPSLGGLSVWADEGN
jgi:hypothetical protein